MYLVIFLLMRLPFSSNSPFSNLNLFSSFLTFFQPNPFPPTWQTHMKMEPTTTTIAAVTTTLSNVTRRRKRKIVVILGPTGAGKSRLSVDLATKYFQNCEIINSDKMQVYSGLDITTNKITLPEQMGIPHHLLGAIDPTREVFTPSDFRKVGSDIVTEIKSRRGLPVIVGGSNSFIYSLCVKRFDPKLDVFNQPDPDPVSAELRFDCCFIWVDVSLPVLNQYLSNRVDEMLDNGLFNELADFFQSGDCKKVNRSGLGQAIGVPEFENYFKKHPGSEFGSEFGSGMDYEEAVRRIKENTSQLAKKQVSKILRLRDAGWELKRIDATETFRAVITAECGGVRVAEIWEKQVVEPSMKIVKQFLDE